MRNRSLRGNIGLIGAIALVALLANGLINDRVPAPRIFAAAIAGTLVIAAVVTTATHRSNRHR